jgi:hypothetical protein
VNSEKPTVLVPSTIGAPFEGGFYGGQIRVGVFLCAIAWAPKAHGEVKGVWLPSYKDVPNATSCFDSMANTRAMAEAGSPIAQQALAADINGHTDWCVPARDVLEMGYRYLKPSAYENSSSFRDGDNASSVPAGYPYKADSPAQTEVEAFRKGGAEAFDEAWYWSSTQSSECSAFFQYFLYGCQDGSGKKFEARARFVRLIQLSA